MQTCQVARQQLGALVADTVGAQQQAAQRVVALQRLGDRRHAEHADAVVAEVRYLTPASEQTAQSGDDLDAAQECEKKTAVGLARSAHDYPAGPVNAAHAGLPAQHDTSTRGW